MDEAAVRSSAAQFGDALVAGNVDAAIEHLSDELKRNVGEVVALLPLPATAVEVASVERGSAALVLQLHVVGETAEDELRAVVRHEAAHLAYARTHTLEESAGHAGPSEAFALAFEDAR